MRCLYKVFGRQQQTCVTLKEKQTNENISCHFSYFVCPLLCWLEIVGDFLSSSKVMNSNVCLFFFPFGQGIRASPSIMERDVKN